MSKHGMFWGSLVLGAFKELLEAKLNGNELRVFLYLCSNMDYRNNICYDNQKAIAAGLAIHKTSVSKAIANLSACEFIAKSSTTKGFMINPNFFYVGKSRPREREELKESFNELLGKRSRFYLDEDEKKLTVDGEY